MTPTFTVRKGHENDAPFLADCNVAMARETEHKELDPLTVSAGVRGLLSRPEYGFYLVAERGGEPVGTLLVTFEWTDWRNGVFWWVQSVYVVPHARRTGVFRALLDAVREQARQDEMVRGLRLYAEQDNEIALATYARLGFAQTSYRMLEMEWEPTASTDE